MKKKLLCLTLALAMLLGLVACGNNNEPADANNPDAPPADTNNPDEPTATPEGFQPLTFDYDTLYDMAFGEFYEALSAAKTAPDSDSRLAMMAAAEAKLLGNGSLMPNTGGGGNYAIGRSVPYSVSGVKWGSDNDREETIMSITDGYISVEERAEMKAKWNELKGTGTYMEWAKKYITEERGHTLSDTFGTTYNGDPTTWDILATFQAVNSEQACMTVDGLLQYDVENIQQPALATSYDVSDDGLVYTFHIREGVKWVDSQGRELGEVQADDWVASLQHAADCGGGQAELLAPVLVGMDDYITGVEPDFSKVGVKAVDQYTLEYTLIEPFSVFTSVMGYAGLFAPMSRSYYESQGGKFGADFDSAAESYVYGSTPNNIAYCGPYLITSWTEKNSIVFNSNPTYWNPDNVNAKSRTVYYISGDDPLQSYNMMKEGTIAAAGLGATALEQCKQDGLFEDNYYLSSVNSSTYVGFFNLARRGYANGNDETKMVSPQTHESADAIDVDAGVLTSDIEDDAARTHVALNNANFRLALSFATNRSGIRAQTVGEDLKNASLRNSYTPADFASLEADTTVTVDGASVSFPAGTWYGEMVQYFLDQAGIPIMVWNPDVEGGSGDGYDGWYNPENAKKFLDKAIEELAAQGLEISAEKPIQIDYPVMAYSPTELNGANAFLQSMNEALGELVKVNLIEATANDEFNYCGYWASGSAQMNYDYGFFSGWTPDYGDAACYLDTLLPQGSGYNTSSCGLW